jgi:ABC-type multidrug transport system ATPase subunit
MIRADNLTFAYPGAAPLLVDLDLEFESGLHLILGRNGCGKSTLFRLLAGVEQPHAGRVLVGGADLWQEEVAGRAALAYVPEVPDLSPWIRAREVARFVARLRGAPLHEADAALTRFALGDLGGRTTRQLSLGQRRRLLLAVASIRTPEHLLLDEPLDGLDQRGRHLLFAWLEKLLADGATVLLSSHELSPIVPLVTHVLWRRGDGWRHQAKPGVSLEELERLALGEPEATSPVEDG